MNEIGEEIMRDFRWKSGQSGIAANHVHVN
jgi:hypothetical protein